MGEWYHLGEGGGGAGGSDGDGRAGGRRGAGGKGGKKAGGIPGAKARRAKARRAISEKPTPISFEERMENALQVLVQTQAQQRP